MVSRFWGPYPPTLERREDFEWGAVTTLETPPAGGQKVRWLEWSRMAPWAPPGSGNAFPPAGGQGGLSPIFFGP